MEDNNLTGKIMVIDDTPANLRLLERMLKNEGYGVRPFPRGALALRAAENDPPDLVLLDINMPEMNGYEVCQRFKEIPALREIPIIFISALSETLDKVKAFGCGGVDYVTKPFQFEEVQARVETHLQLRRYQRELRMHNENLQQLVDDQVQEIVRGKEELSRAQMATIAAMSKLAESRDDDTGAHIERVQTYCRTLAEKLREVAKFAPQLDDAYIENLYCAAPLHDIGKVGIPDSILCKPGKLTPEEFEIMKTHAPLGAETLAAVCQQYPNNAFVNMGIEIARSHHEKWNGKGYPDGLAGDAIPLAARIVAVADVYDALRSERCYKPPFPHEKSRDIIISDTGTHFDPDVGQAFAEIAGEFAAIRERLNE